MLAVNELIMIKTFIFYLKYMSLILQLHSTICFITLYAKSSGGGFEEEKRLSLLFCFCPASPSRGSTLLFFSLRWWNLPPMQKKRDIFWIRAFLTYKLGLFHSNNAYIRTFPSYPPLLFSLQLLPIL